MEPNSETEAAASSAAAPAAEETPAPAAIPSPAPAPAAAEPAAEAADAGEPAEEVAEQPERPENSDESDQSDEEGTSGEAAAVEGESAPADDPLSQLVAQAQQRRLSPTDEERASKLLQGILLEGRTGVARAIEVLPKLAWVIGVNAVTTVWQEMKPTFRTRLLAGLARVDSEAARRVRLSLARGIFKQDVPAALKIAVSVAKDMRQKEQPGTIGQKNAQIFANVFIGRAKPWVTQLPLAELKPAEADLLVQTAALAVFSLPHPPATQLGILKWGAEGGRLGRLSEPATAAIVKGLDRWNGKWRGALHREVAELPEPIVAALKVETLAPAPAPSGETAEGEREEKGEASERSDESDLSDKSDRSDSAESADEREKDEEDEEDEDEEDEEAGEEKAQAAPQPQRPRPVYESKTMPSRGGRENRPFSLPETLRSIEQYVNGLRNELQQAQNRLRQRDDDGRRRRDQERAAPIPGAPTPDELARLNQQLEARNTELQARIDEMREDAEMRAASGGAASEPDAAEAAAQLRSLLALKLQEDFADFLALELEAPDLVIKRHYPVLLRHVFEVLRQEGVPLTEPPAEGAPPAP
jgi:hypothetical protein